MREQSEHCASNRTDLVDNRRTYFLLWGVPRLVIVATLPLSDGLKTAVWTGALTQMGVACLVNASGCNRLHCYFTGPLYLFGALASLLRGTGALKARWGLIGLAALAGGFVLGRLPEMLWGRYANKNDTPG
jgi:hypothetical protein